MTGQTPLGSKLLVCLFLGIAFWGRFPWWGGLWPLGTKVLHNDSPKGRGGPWAPPPRLFFKAVLFFLCFFFFFFCFCKLFVLSKVCCFGSFCEAILALQVSGPCLLLDVLVLFGVPKGKGGWLHRPPRLVSFRMTGVRRTD